MRSSVFIVACAIVASACAGEAPEEEANGDEQAVTSTPPAHVLDAEEQAFLQKLNEYRAENGKAPLKADGLLNAVAYAFSKDLDSCNVKFGHVGSDGRGPFERMTDAGYIWRSAAENVAAGNAAALPTFEQ